MLWDVRKQPKAKAVRAAAKVAEPTEVQLWLLTRWGGFLHFTPLNLIRLENTNESRKPF
jgi:hypothetical protein